jgi:prepilin-type N-terminal cleavage/methylation domain-containing protein
MKRFSQSMRGVTLLEIMLVLAIAAMIVVMSIRYYQSASSAQQANAAAGQVQAVMAAMDNLGMSAGYNGANVTQANLAAVVGVNNMTTPTGGTITLGATTATTYTLTVPLNTTICPSVAAKLAGNAKITNATCAGGTLNMSYNSTR